MIDRDAAFIPARRRCRRCGRFDQRDVAAACSETGSEAGADEAPTHDGHIENVITHAFHAAINFSIAAISFGAPSVSTRGPCSVITTSSSMRMPIPQLARASGRERVCPYV